MLESGLIVGNYRVIRLLGKGGMGCVYLVKHLTLGVEYAMKVLKDDAAESDEYVARFLREGKLASHIRHPNLIAVYDAGRDSRTGLYYLVMDYVSGGTLAGRIQKDGALPPHQALAIVRQVALALDAAAAQGMVHRDIKPANIMFDADGRVRVADLGIAKRRGDDETTMTRDDAVFGTPAYMSPEQARDTGKVDVRSDIYSLGMVLWHALTGARPYADSTAMAIFMSVLDKRPLPDVREKNPAVPQEVAELVKDMCAKDVDRRVQSPQELIRRIDALVAPAEETTMATVVTSPSPLPRVAVARSIRILWSVVAVVVVAIVLCLAAVLVLKVSKKDGAVATLPTCPAQEESASEIIPGPSLADSEEDAAQQKEAAEAARQKAVEEAKRKQAAKEAKQKQAAEEAKRKQAAAAEARLRAEEEARRKAEQRVAEAEASSRGEETRRLAEVEAVQKAEDDRQAAERKRLEDEARLAAAAMGQTARTRHAEPAPLPRPQAVRATANEPPSRDYAKLSLAAFGVGNWSLGYQYACQDKTENAEVLFWLGKCFDPGVEMPGFRHKKDAVRAREYYRRAAERGSAAAKERSRNF